MFSLDLNFLWTVTLGFAASALVYLLQRLFDPAFLFRRLLVSWVTTGIVLFAGSSIFLSYVQGGLQIGLGQHSGWIIVAWSIGFVGLLIAALKEAKAP